MEKKWEFLAECEVERGPLSHLAFRPDLASVAADNARARPQLTPFQWSTPASTEADSTNGDGQKGIPVLRKELQPQAGPEIEWVCEELAPPRMFCYRKSKPDAPQSSSTAAVSVQLEAAVPDAAPSAAP